MEGGTKAGQAGQPPVLVFLGRPNGQAVPVAAASTCSRYVSRCKGCAGPIGAGAPIFLWDRRQVLILSQYLPKAWVCAGCNRKLSQPEVRVVQIAVKTDWVEELFRSVPVEHLQRVCRALAAAFHPDVGGDLEIMKRVNMAHEKRARPK